MFSVPLTDEGKLFIKQLQRFGHRIHIRCRGRGLQPGNDWRPYTRFTPLSKATWAAVYVEHEPTKKMVSLYWRRCQDAEQRLLTIRNNIKELALEDA